MIERARTLALVAVLLLAACAGGKRTGPTPSLAEAYRLQDELARSAVARGDRLVGYKVAFTSEALRRAWGVAEPLSGFLLESMAVADGGRIDPAALASPRLELEVAFVIGRPVEAPFKDVSEARGHVRSVHAALELVDAETPAAGRPPVAEIVAGGVGARRFVLGRPVTPGALELDGATVELRVAGQQRRGGTLDESVLSPWDTLVWLSAHLAARGVQLQPGSVVLSGSLLPPLEGPLDGRVEAVIGPLGGVSCAAR